MKTAIISIDNTDYMIVFNNAVLTRMEDLGISLSELRDSKKPVTQINQMMVLMIEQGAKYAARKGLGAYPTITVEDFNELTDYSDYASYQGLIADLITGDRQVDAVPAKKAGAEAEAAPTN